MEVDLEMVRTVFMDVLEGRLSREAADRWAFNVVQQAEQGSLMFSPVTAREQIWEGVMFLYGIDSLEAPGEYLHSEEDIRLAMTEKLGG